MKEVKSNISLGLSWFGVILKMCHHDFLGIFLPFFLNLMGCFQVKSKQLILENLETLDDADSDPMTTQPFYTNCTNAYVRWIALYD